jgi:hypothetical protein
VKRDQQAPETGPANFSPNGLPRGSHKQTARIGKTLGKIDLFIPELAPNLVRQSRFQAQYRFNRPAAAGGFHAVSGAAVAPAGSCGCALKKLVL